MQMHQNIQWIRITFTGLLLVALVSQFMGFLFLSMVYMSIVTEAEEHQQLDWGKTDDKR